MPWLTRAALAWAMLATIAAGVCWLGWEGNTTRLSDWRNTRFEHALAELRWQPDLHRRRSLLSIVGLHLREGVRRIQPDRQQQRLHFLGEELAHPAALVGLHLREGVRMLRAPRDANEARLCDEILEQVQLR